MKKYLLSLITLSLLLCEASFTGGGVVFAVSSGSCGTNVTYTLSDAGVLTITGTGAMTDYASSTGMPWNSDKTSVTSIIINEGVTTIGNRAFYGCSNATSVEISSTVTSIGQYAFSGCTKLGTIKFGTSTDYQCNIDTIKGSAFSNCTAVYKVYCYGSDADNAMARWLNIGFNATTSSPFYASTVTSKYFYLNGLSKTSITISGDQVKPYAFYKSPVSTVTLSASVQTIGVSAFDGSKLSTLNFAEDAELTRICTRAFAACTSLKTPTLPVSLTTIEGNAFNGCTSTNFKSITIPENVTICGDGVFTGCSQLNTVVWNAKNCTTYDGTNPYKTNYGPFYNSTVKGQITSFTFGDAVEVIPLFCCYNMPNITLLTVPESVESIGEKAFSGCTGLTTIVAKPVDPSSCGTNAFESVNKDIPVVLTSPTSVADYRSAGGWSDFTNISNTLSGSCGTNATWTLNLATGLLTISGTGAMTDYSTSDSNRSPWYKFNSYITDIVVSSGITTLGEACFANCEVDTCTIPASVTNFKTQCFFSVKVNNLYYQGTLANWCALTLGQYNPLPTTQKLYISSSEITDLVLPSISALNAKAFMNMKGITSVTIPSSIETIGADAFVNCSKIDSVRYQGSLAQWCAINFSNDQEANPAFNGASLHITDSDISDGAVFVKDAITSIGNYAFCGVNNYESIEINAATTIGTYTFKNCTAQILYRGSASGTSGNVSWTWNNGVLTLTGTGTMTNYSSTSAPWYQYMGSTTSISVGEGITSIGNSAFYGTSASPITISLPSTLTTIGNSAFTGLKDLREVTIPSGVTSIGTGAFQSCTNLEKIYCLPATAPSLVNAAGGGYTQYTSFANNAPLYVSPSSYTSYSGSSMAGFGANFFIYGDCGADSDSKNVQWVLSSKTGVMSFIGSGNVRGYGNGTTPWYSLRAMIKSAEFSEGITATGGWCFQDCSNLATVSLPSTLTIVSVRTFNATAITSIEIPEGVTKVDNFAFYNCTALEDVNLPSTLTQIGSSVFEGCTGLASIDLPEGLTSIGTKAFVGCTSLASITIPRSVTAVSTSSGSYTFNGCTALRTVNWNADSCGNFNKQSNDGKTFTYYTPFGNIKDTITSFNFGANVRVIPSCLCEGMTNITSVTLPSSVKTINQDVFHGCTGLTSITIPANVGTIGGTVFEGCTNLASVTCEAETPPTIQNTTFSTPDSKTLITSCNTRADYEEANHWSSFGTFLPARVNFDLQGYGAEIDAQCIDAETATEPDEPTNNIFAFGGWYEEAGCENEYNFSTAITADKTLYAKWVLKNAITLADTENNTALLAIYDTHTVDVNLTRTIRHESYNTICLPFSISAEQVEAAFGADCDIQEMTDARANGENIDLVFTQRDAIEAGKPYLIQPTATVEYPSFSSVTISNSTINSVTNYIDFKGVFSPTELDNSEDLLFLGANNKLFMSSGGTMNGLRAYFAIHSPAALAAAAAKHVRLSFNNENTATGLETVIGDSLKVTGRKFILDGQLYIERDGRTYNAQGALVK